MGTENAVGLRLKSVNPEKIVPNFIRWLSQKGKVEIGEITPLELSEHRVRADSGETQALTLPIRLNGVQIGYLEFYTNPLAVSYIGHREECMELTFERTRSLTHENLIKEMGLTYLWEPSRGDEKREGRVDGHKKIPFP